LLCNAAAINVPCDSTDVVGTVVASDWAIRDIVVNGTATKETFPAIRTVRAMVAFVAGLNKTLTAPAAAVPACRASTDMEMN
jgi:hypothetical protein